ncbi:MFS transporter [Pseudahrensia aquimaris]|uniref:MFS transporter n=1 Tax=Pseudahrensia aquimaris TaxID=744461 RepID=A0ABW3FIQ5_9HYPH
MATFKSANFYIDNSRWLVAGFLLTLSSAFGQTFFISIFGSEIRAEYGLTHGEFGTIYMVATLASALCFPIVGRLVDVTSVWKCSLLVMSMLALAALSMSLISSVWLLVATIFALRLFGQGMMGHTALTAMGRWYSSNRGKAVSVVSIGHQTSEAIVPILFASIALSFGWRQAWLAAAVYVVAMIPLVVSLMRVERMPAQQAAEEGSRNEVGKQWRQGEVLRDPLFWMVCMGVLSPAFIGTSIWFHQDYLIELNQWPEQTYYASFSLMAFTTIIVSLITGVLIDRFSAIQMLPFFLIPLAIACFVLGTQSAVPAIFVTMFTIGLSYGMSSPIFGALWPEAYGTRYLGAVRSLVMAFMVFASAAGPGVTGILIDLGVSFPRQLVFIGAYCLIAMVVMIPVSRQLVARRVAYGWQPAS